MEEHHLYQHGLCSSSHSLEFAKPFSLVLAYPHMHVMRSLKRYTHLLLSVLVLAGCSSAGYNQTAFPFVYHPEYLPPNAKRLVLAPVNFGIPSKNYLKKYEDRVDRHVVKRLENAGYTFVSRSLFNKAWRDAIRKYGSPYNELTAQLNEASFKRVMYESITALKEDGHADAVVFTDLVERQVVFGNSLNRVAKWDGVARKPRLKGGTEGVKTGFDWTQNVPAVSLATNIYSVDGKLVFSSRGGLEVSRHLAAINGNGRFVRRDKLFLRNANVQEGVSLALHPFATMRDYPIKK